MIRFAWRPQSLDRRVASVRLRCLLPLEVLTAQGLPVGLLGSVDAPALRAVVFSKAYDRPNQELADRLRRRGVKVVLDLCDNHFFNPRDLPEYRERRRDMLAMLQRCDEVVCASRELADAVAGEAQLRHRPTVIGDPVVEVPAVGAVEGGAPRLLWYGNRGQPNAPGGMLDLQWIAPHLERAARKTPLLLVVLSNDRGLYERHVRPLPVASEYVEWSEEAQQRELRRARAVVIPVALNPFTRCKSNNRLAQALAAGVPAVADRVPSYEELAPFCELGDWPSGLGAVLANPAGPRTRARAGQRYVLERYGLLAIAEQWRRLLAPLGDAHDLPSSTDTGRPARPERHET